MTDSRPNPREGVGRKASKPPAVRPQLTQGWWYMPRAHPIWEGILVGPDGQDCRARFIPHDGKARR
jgi:hypothetical protein